MDAGTYFVRHICSKDFNIHNQDVELFEYIHKLLMEWVLEQCKPQC